MATGERKDPFRGYNFRVEIDNLPVAGFREASGISLTTDSVEYREGTDVPLHPRKLMAMRKYANIVLKRGYTDSDALWLWYRNVVNGVDDRRNGAIILQDEQHRDVVRWSFENGWICKYEGATLNATSNDVAIEGIEICVEQVALE